LPLDIGFLGLEMISQRGKGYVKNKADLHWEIVYFPSGASNKVCVFSLLQYHIILSFFWVDGERSRSLDLAGISLNFKLNLRRITFLTIPIMVFSGKLINNFLGFL
jgi:hypothetical protein